MSLQYSSARIGSCGCSARPGSISHALRPFTARAPAFSGVHARRMVHVASSAATDSYFVATNNFKVKPEHAAAFEEVWKKRESRLNECPGFIRFALLRCDEPGEYMSQTHWATRSDFEAWTKSQQFGKAHAGVSRKPEAGNGGGEKKKPSTMEMMEGPPKVKLYETVTVTEREA